MSQTLINGTAYEIDHGNTLISGTGYEIEKGNTLISGTAYEIILKEEEVVNYEDYYLNLTPHQDYIYYSSSGKLDFSSIQGITDPFEQIDTIIWTSNSNEVTFFFYRKMGQDATGSWLPVVSRYNSHDPWWATNSNTEDTYWFSRQQFESGTDIQLWYNNHESSTNGVVGAGTKVYVEWHEVTT